MIQVTSAAVRRSYRFGPFLADTRKRLLWRDGQLLSLTPKAFEILVVLIEHRGRVVEKDEVVNAVWGDVAVEDATLARHISTLRRTLDERPNQHLYIVTVPGHGYEFVADIVELEEPAPTPVPLPEPPPPATAGVTTAVTKEPGDAMALAAAGLVVEHGGNETHSAGIVPVRPDRRLMWTALTATVVLVGSAAIFTALTAARRPAMAPQRALRQFTFHGGLQREPAWSPDGQNVAYVSDAGGNSDIWVQSATDTEAKQLTRSAAEDTQPDWSPDGRSVVFRSERDGGGLYVVSAEGSGERALSRFGYRPKWSPDGRRVLFFSSGHLGGSSRLFMVDSGGGTPSPVRPDVLEGLTVAGAGWRPDGTAVSVWGRRSNGESVFMTMPVDGGAATTSVRHRDVDEQIKEAGVTLGRFTWARSGRYLYFEGTSERVRNVWRVTVDPTTLAWTSGPERLTTGTGEDTDITLSPDGSRMVFSTRVSRTRLWTFPFDPAAGRLEGNGVPVTSGATGEQDADALVDGSKLVYRAIRGNRQEIWERRLPDGGERLLISTTEWNRTRPRWSHDGLTIAYLRTRSGTQRAEPVVAVLPAGGTERAITKPGEIDLVPTDWSRDGRWLLGSCPIGSPRSVGSCVLPVADSLLTPDALRIIAAQPGKNLFESRFSPNQHWVSFVAVDRQDARSSTIYVVPAKGGEWTALTEGRAYDDKPHWSQDGRTLYFISNRDGFFNVWGRRVDPETGRPDGAAFRVTAFSSARQVVSADLARTQIAVTATHLFLPITETAGELWMLDHVDR